MMIAIPAPHWALFRALSPQAFASALQELVASVDVAKYRRLLLDSRGVDVPRSYHPIVMTLSSVKPFFVNGLKKAWRSSDNVGA